MTAASAAAVAAAVCDAAVAAAAAANSVHAHIDSLIQTRMSRSCLHVSSTPSPNTHARTYTTSAHTLQSCLSINKQSLKKRSNRLFCPLLLAVLQRQSVWSLRISSPVRHKYTCMQKKYIIETGSCVHRYKWQCWCYGNAFKLHLNSPQTENICGPRAEIKRTNAGGNN